ncbi:MAG: dehydrogenase [Leptothrix sp. (in: Bacteria)]|nr:dehydrogenase [Leptothrix sp. (in: b-proteobacteria)]
MQTPTLPRLVRARAPLRLGLAGGGTDVSPYCDEYGGHVLNATIDRYAYATLRLLDEPVLRFVAADRQCTLELPLDAPLDGPADVGLHLAVYRRLVEPALGRRLPLEIVTFCDAPSGSGLGSSSTLVVAMVRAFAELLNLPLDDYAIAHLAFQIERVDCALAGGRQDQYSATFGGFNFMEFYANERAVINPLRIKSWILSELEASLVLFYTGVSRESARIIADQSSGIAARNEQAVAAMHGLKHEALTMKECLLRGDLDGIVASMQQGWMNKKRTARTVSTPQVDAVYDAAMAAGARAGKVSGAGGGGFMMFFVRPEQRMDVLRALAAFDGQASHCHFTKHGAQAWRP